MERVKKQLKEMFVYSGVTVAEYEESLEELRRKDRNALRKSCFIGCGLLVLLSVISSFMSSLIGNIPLYIGTFLCLVMIYGLLVWSEKADKNMILPLCYVFLITVYGFAIVIGTVGQPDFPAVTFCALLCVGPLLFLDKPYRMTILTVCMTAVFCGLSFALKELRLAQLDCLNSVSFAALSIAVNVNVMKTKMRDLTQYRYITRENDTDELTKLMTKAAVERDVQGYMRATGLSAVLLILDLDDFKSINDTFGHTYGDAVLRKMGQCIKKVFRETDIKGRFGGDEFVLFLPGLDKRDVIISRVEMLISLMQSHINLPDNAGEVHASIGIALYPEHACTYEELFRCADEALYESKKHGKHCYTFYLDFPRIPMYRKD